MAKNILEKCRKKGWNLHFAGYKVQKGLKTLKILFLLTFFHASQAASQEKDLRSQVKMKKIHKKRFDGG